MADKDFEKDGLFDLLSEDKNLTGDSKMLYLSLATFFEQDFTENLYLTSVELDSKYGTNTPTAWRKFLSLTTVKNFLEDFRDEDMEVASNRALTGTPLKASEALKLKKKLDEKKNVEDNSNIVVMLMPQKKYI